MSSDGLIDDSIVLLSFLDISACPILFYFYIDRRLQKFTTLVVPIVVPKVQNITKGIFTLASTGS